MGVEHPNLNVARAFVGRHVNLHLRDGSVLVNVYITETAREDDSGKPIVLCIAQHRLPPVRVLLREIEWMEQLNPYVFS